MADDGWPPITITLTDAAAVISTAGIVTASIPAGPHAHTEAMDIARAIARQYRRRLPLTATDSSGTIAMAVNPDGHIDVLEDGPEPQRPPARRPALGEDLSTLDALPPVLPSTAEIPTLQPVFLSTTATQIPPPPAIAPRVIEPARQFLAPPAIPAPPAPTRIAPSRDEIPAVLYQPMPTLPEQATAIAAPPQQPSATYSEIPRPVWAPTTRGPASEATPSASATSTTPRRHRPKAAAATLAGLTILALALTAGGGVRLYTEHEAPRPTPSTTPSSPARPSQEPSPRAIRRAAPPPTPTPTAEATPQTQPEEALPQPETAPVPVEEEPAPDQAPAVEPAAPAAPAAPQAISGLQTSISTAGGGAATVTVTVQGSGPASVTVSIAGAGTTISLTAPGSGSATISGIPLGPQSWTTTCQGLANSGTITVY